MDYPSAGKTDRRIQRHSEREEDADSRFHAGLTAAQLSCKNKTTMLGSFISCSVAGRLVVRRQRANPCCFSDRAVSGGSEGQSADTGAEGPKFWTLCGLQDAHGAAEVGGGTRRALKETAVGEATELRVATRAPRRDDRGAVAPGPRRERTGGVGGGPRL